MEISVLAYQTQLAILAGIGNVQQENDYHCSLLPDNPGWYWGSFMVRKAPPQPGELSTWESAFRAATSHIPDIRHCSFAWNPPANQTPLLAEFVQAGYAVHRSTTLLLPQPAPRPPASTHFELRALSSDADWHAATDLQVLVDQEKYVGGHGAYKARQMQAYRKLCTQQKGIWLGAWRGGQLVGDLGVFSAGKQHLRLQQVETHPDHRRQGICSLLLDQVARTSPSGNQIVVVADAGTPSPKVYAQAGCRPVEHTLELSKAF